MIKYRVVKVNCGQYAVQRKISVLGISPFGWDYV